METYGTRFTKPFCFQRTKTQEELNKFFGLEADNAGYIILSARNKILRGE